MEELELRELRLEDEAEFLAAKRDFAESEPWFRFALGYDACDGFADYVAATHVWPRGERLFEGFVRNSFLVAVVGERIVGRVSLRHELNDFLAERGGHIGYGVVPSARRCGYATAMLRMSLPIAAAAGLERVLVTCDDGNEPSQRVIETNGGVLADVIPAADDQPALRRYWISLGGTK